MKQIPRRIQHPSSILKNPSVPLSPHNPQQRGHAILQRVLPLIEFPKHLKEIIIISQILSGGTHSISACEKILCHNPKVIEQCKKR